MTRRACCLLLILPLATAPGCAEYLRINSNPAGAQVWVNANYLGKTPITCGIGRYDPWPDDLRVRVEADGYEPFEGQLRRRVAPGRVVFIVMFAGLPLLWRRPNTFADRQYDVALRPEGGPAAAPPEVSQDAADRLRQIQDLYDEGLISEQEYRQQRSRVLKGL